MVTTSEKLFDLTTQVTIVAAQIFQVDNLQPIEQLFERVLMRLQDAQKGVYPGLAYLNGILVVALGRFESDLVKSERK